jgi:hypothetical protein
VAIKRSRVTSREVIRHRPNAAKSELRTDR